MTTLKAEKRDLSKKAKALRRQGMIIGVVYGREMKDNIPIQISAVDATRFMKDHSKGSQTMLEVDGQSIDVLLKDTDFDPATHQYLSVDFQALVADEKVTSTAPIILVNEDKTTGFLTHNLSELSYKALPSALIEKVEIDIEKIPVGTNLLVKDLEVAANKDIEILTPMDTSVVHIAEHQKHAVAAEAEEAAEGESAVEA